jgi:2-keto-4-pentenoate hydratase/2-oxohepta-3-ene-1,7-dioic acid hydratase in catechol pathway
MRFIVGHHRAQRPAHGAAQPVSAVFVIQGDRAVNLSERDPALGADLTGLMGQADLRGLVARLTSGAPTVALADIVPDLPVARPGKVMCLGLNYIDHIKEGGYAVPDYPALFMRGLNSLMPAGAPMLRPRCSEQLDYEVELMVIVGRGGKHISEAQALAHVFGYTVFNDGSVRDYQRKTHQWTPGKNFDATGAIGPVVVTPDELPEGATGLKVQTRVGKEILQSSNTSDMLWSVAKVIAAISEFATLEPGDLIAMGTPPGVGHARKPPRWLRPGEVVEVEIEGIGVCASPIVAEQDIG